jgi:hypothetical protein
LEFVPGETGKYVVAEKFETVPRLNHGVARESLAWIS